MAGQPSYEELEALCNHLSQQLVGMGDRLQATLREQMAKAWEEGAATGWALSGENSNGDHHAFYGLNPPFRRAHAETPNPYKEA